MQDRAILTRQAILAAAAGVFEERGYRAATISEILARAGVTRGALYFHFPSKEDLAEGVIREQDGRLPAVGPQCAVQQLVDTVVLHAHRLRTDPVVRAGVRLALDQQAEGLDRGGSFRRWGEVGTGLLEQARERGELLPHVVPAQTAGVLVGAFAGVQALSRSLSGYQDLPRRVTGLLRHVLPSVVIPPVLAAVDLSETRGAWVQEQLQDRGGVPGPAPLT